jgi:hypothetical protein
MFLRPKGSGIPWPRFSSGAGWANGLGALAPQGHKTFQGGARMTWLFRVRPESIQPECPTPLQALAWLPPSQLSWLRRHPDARKRLALFAIHDSRRRQPSAAATRTPVSLTHTRRWRAPARGVGREEGAVQWCERESQCCEDEKELRSERAGECSVERL